MAISSNSQQNKVDAKKDSATIKALNLLTGSSRAQSWRIDRTTLSTFVNLIQEISEQNNDIYKVFLQPRERCFKLALIQNHIIELQQSPPFPKSSPQADLVFDYFRTHRLHL